MSTLNNYAKPLKIQHYETVKTTAIIRILLLQNYRLPVLLLSTEITFTPIPLTD